MIQTLTKAHKVTPSDCTLYTDLPAETDIIGEVALSRMPGPLPRAPVLCNVTAQSGEGLIDAFCRFLGIQKGASAVKPMKEKMVPFATRNIGKVEGELSSAVRGVWGFLVMFGSQTSSDGILGVGAQTSILSGISGCLNWINAKERLKEASQGVIQDEYTKLESKVDIVKSGVKVASGGIMTFNQQAILVCSARGVESGLQASTMAGRIAGFSGLIGSTFSGAFLLLYTAWGSLSAKELYSFIDRYKGESYEESIEFFQKELEITPKTTYLDLEEKAKLEGVGARELLCKEGITSVRMYLKEAATFVGKDFNEEVEIEDSDVQAFLAAEGSIKMEEITKELSLWDPDWENLFTGSPPTNTEILGLYVACKKQKDIKEAEIKRSIGEEAFQMLEEHLEKAPQSVTKEEKASFLEEVKNGYWKEAKWQVLFLSVLSVAAVITAISVVGMFVVSPALALSVLTLNVFIAFVLLAIEGSLKVRSLGQEGSVFLADKIAANANVLLGVGCLIAVIVLSSATMGAAPVAIAIAIGAAWVVIAVVDLASLHWKEHKYKEKHLSEEELTARMLQLKNKVAAFSSSKDIEAQRKKVERSFVDTIRNSFIPEEEKDRLYERFYKVIEVKKIGLDEIQQFKEMLSNWKKQEQVIRDAVEETFKFFPSTTGEKQEEAEVIAEGVRDLMHSLLNPEQEATV